MTDDWRQQLSVGTAPSAKERQKDVWDDDNCCNYSADGRKLLDAFNFPGTVHVKEGTQIICDEAFAFQDYMDEDRRLGEHIPEDERISYLEKIFLPSTVTHIGAAAFRECGWMKSIRLPKSLRVIGEDAFFGCWQLRSISLPAATLVVGDGAFAECFELSKVRLNKGLKAIGAEAFYYCDSLTEIYLPSSLEFIGSNAFMGAKSLRTIFVAPSARSRIAAMLPPSMARKIRNIK
jgi:hypothetical protein